MTRRRAAYAVAVVAFVFVIVGTATGAVPGPLAGLVAAVVFIPAILVLRRRARFLERERARVENSG